MGPVLSTGGRSARCNEYDVSRELQGGGIWPRGRVCLHSLVHVAHPAQPQPDLGTILAPWCEEDSSKTLIKRFRNFYSVLTAGGVRDVCTLAWFHHSRRYYVVQAADFSYSVTRRRAESHHSSCWNVGARTAHRDHDSKQPAEVKEISPHAHTRLENPCDETALPSFAHVSLIARMSSTLGSVTFPQPQRRTSSPFTVELGRAIVEPSALGAAGPSPRSKGSPSNTPEISKLENVCACAPCASSNAETAVAAAVVESILLPLTRTDGGLALLAKIKYDAEAQRRVTVTSAASNEIELVVKLCYSAKSILHR